MLSRIGVDAALRETWLRPNRRAIWFGCVPPLAVVALGAWMALGAAGSSKLFWCWLGTALIVAGIALIAYLIGQLRRPRVAYHDGQVQFYLRSGGPISVPVGHVEAFFLGRSDAPLPGALGRQQTANLVARISQRASNWLRQDVKPALGSWCSGYVTIRGTWCEPLENDLIRRLNHRLHEVQTETRTRHADD